MKALRLLVAFLIGCCMVLASSAQEQISLSIYVHEGNLNGTMLTGAQVRDCSKIT